MIIDFCQKYLYLLRIRYFRVPDALRMIRNGEVLMATQKQSTKNEEDPIYPDEVHK